MTVASGALLYRAYESTGQRVYVVSDTGSFSAQIGRGAGHTPFEARNLVKTFLLTMFGHDQYSFKHNLDAGLPLIEERGGRFLFESFQRGQVLQNYIRYGARQAVTVDSIHLDMNHRPITGRAYIKQTVFIGDQQSQSKPLGAKFALVETDRSDANPFGLLITDFDFIAYNPPVSQEEKDQLRDQEQARQRKLREEAEAAGVPCRNPPPRRLPPPLNLPSKLPLSPSYAFPLLLCFLRAAGAFTRPVASADPCFDCHASCRRANPASGQRSAENAAGNRRFRLLHHVPGLSGAGVAGRRGPGAALPGQD
ncbi:hypothetical protein [Hymenobacter sp. 102]|uniref:hypothetical protein n=1 Tax=Hymenobacter sp. 102 TaxID=3403152 RepID=UPI003CED0A73